ncbi:MAG: hypothetical protein Ta2E_02390 [Mycoplasmoidaceae bacterium]|nr:MAG: hypothetical protein Ta2E_02390 [Mycoplasmoidaceae bacterium]
MIFRSAIRYFKNKKTFYSKNKKIVKYLKSTKNSEYITIANSILKHRFSNNFIPYIYIYINHKNKIKVFKNNSGFKYVLHNNKKLYFPEKYSNRRIKRCYLNLVNEQNENSPHSYSLRTLKKSDIILDLGGAEGIWTLTNIDAIFHSYIFECDKKWIKPLQLTFAPYKDKVTIVEKFVSDRNSDEFITIDKYCYDNNISPNVIKADIEGYEPLMLKGCTQILNKAKTDFILCTYHKQNDGKDIENIIKNYPRYQFKYTKGYMLCWWFDRIFEKPYLRKGVIYIYHK